MPEVSEKLRDISAASRARIRRLHFTQEAYLAHRQKIGEKLKVIYPHLHPDYLLGLRDLMKKEKTLLHEMGEIMLLMGKDTNDFIEEIKEIIANA